MYYIQQYTACKATKHTLTQTVQGFEINGGNDISELKKQNCRAEVEFTGIIRKLATEVVAEIIGTTVSRLDYTYYQTRIIRYAQGRPEI